LKGKAGFLNFGTDKIKANTGFADLTRRRYNINFVQFWQKMNSSRKAWKEYSIVNLFNES
jgi:hypothetical protein